MKAAHLYLGVGGTCCDLCNFSKERCLDPDQIEMDFEINRDINSLQNLFNVVVQDDGSILKRHNDYDERGGLTMKPISSKEVLSVQVLQASLRIFDHYMKTDVHLRAGVFDWSESPTSINIQFLATAKGQIQNKILMEIGEQWDYPDQTGKGGPTTTGNTAQNVLHREIW